VKRLIVNADDFGLTAGVNRAIVELNRHGTLTSATLMASASSTAEAIDLARSTPDLGAGCHVVLVDGTAVTPVELLPSLTAAKSFSPTLSAFLSRTLLAQRLSIQSDIETEAFAQISLLQSRGMHLTHIDTHKHTHMFPRVLRPVLRAARAAGIRVVRNPFEPEWSIRATPRAPWLRRLQVRLLRMLEPTFRRIVAEEGFATTDGAIGVLATGTLDTEAITSLLDAMPDGTWELVTHPGYDDADLANARTRLLASRETELQALLATRIPPNVQLIHFGQLGNH
jgi:predicted glycoside hydrolase/deacetylase ChbG (UPF0249 family)